MDFVQGSWEVTAGCKAVVIVTPDKEKRQRLKWEGPFTMETFEPTQLVRLVVYQMDGKRHDHDWPMPANQPFEVKHEVKRGTTRLGVIVTVDLPKGHEAAFEEITLYMPHDEQLGKKCPALELARELKQAAERVKELTLVGGKSLAAANATVTPKSNGKKASVFSPDETILSPMQID